MHIRCVKKFAKSVTKISQTSYWLPKICFLLNIKEVTGMVLKTLILNILNELLCPLNKQTINQRNLLQQLFYRYSHFEKFFLLFVSKKKTKYFL